MQDQTLNFNDKIKLGLEQRIAKNPQYSLRSYAKQLGVSPATLSGIINGKRNLTPLIVGKIGNALGLTPEEIWNYQRQLLGSSAEIVTDQFAILPQDVFAIISEWYHLTILELIKLEDFKPNYNWIAKRLNINVNQAKLAVERLEKVGILEIQKNGKWVDRMGGFTTHYQKEKTTEARKRYQQQLLEKSLESLRQDDYSIRDHSSTTMAINAKNVMKAKLEIQKFRKKLSNLLENQKTQKDEIYQLQVSFFPLTKKINKSKDGI